MAEFQKINRLLLDRQLSGDKGADSRQAPWLLDQRTVADVQGLRIADVGKFTRNAGSAARGGRTDAPQGGMQEFLDGQENIRFTSMWGQKIYKSAGGADWTQIACGASLTDHLYLALPGRIQGSRSLGFVAVEDDTGRGPFVIYDVQNDTFTQITAVTNPRCCAFFQQRYWLGSGDDLFFSDISETAGFSSVNVIGAEPGLGGAITAIIPARDLTPRIYVLKDEAVMLLEPRWGSSSALIPAAGDALDFISTNFITLTVGVGCIATKSVQWVPGNQKADVLFLAQDGVRALSRAEQDAQAGAGFPDTYGIKAWTDRINFDAAHRASAAVFDNAYHLAVPLDGATENTHLLRRETAGGGWSLIDLASRDMKAFRLGSGHRLFFQSNLPTFDTSVTDSSTDSLFQVYRAFSGSFDSPGATHVHFSLTTRAFVGEDPKKEKSWQELSFLLSASDTCAMEIFTRVNLGAWNTLATLVVGGTGGGDVVLGESPLPWGAAGSLARRQQFDLSRIEPGESLQVRFDSVTGVSVDRGRFVMYMVDVQAFDLPGRFETEM